MALLLGLLPRYLNECNEAINQKSLREQFIEDLLKRLECEKHKRNDCKRKCWKEHGRYKWQQ